MISFENLSGIVKTISASDDQIITVENSMNILLPKTYKELLRMTNGFSTDGGLTIYGTDDIVERNTTLEVDEYAKGYIAIGDDSGDDVFLISTDDTKEEILVVGCGDMNPSNAKIISNNLSEWLDNEFDLSKKIINNSNPNQTTLYNILLLDIPDGGFKDIVKIKNILNLEMSSSELLKIYKELPFPIVSNITYGKALNYLEKLTEFTSVLKLQNLNE